MAGISQSGTGSDDWFFRAGIADLLSGQNLQIIIGIFAIWVAYRMFKGAT
jgi:hypothetical protein